MGVIPEKFSTLASNYPRRDKKDSTKYKYVDQVMKGIPGTPCCVQMSHALNMSGIPIPPTSYRRHNTRLKIDGRVFYYILAVDELEEFLFSSYGDDGEAINMQLGKPRSPGEIKNYISNRTGLLLFRYADFRKIAPPGQFEHTELWDGTKILQRDMNEGFLFARPRVLMWDTTDIPRWLVDYMGA